MYASWQLLKTRFLSCFLVFSLTATSSSYVLPYPWYLIWVMPFVALSFKNTFLVWLTISLSAGTLLRYAPFLYTGSWGGITPKIKLLVTITPVVFVLAKFGLVSFWFKKK